jgi:hypothetical protein
MGKRNRPHLLKILNNTLIAGVEKRKLSYNKFQDVFQELKAIISCTSHV